MRTCFSNKHEWRSARGDRGRGIEISDTFVSAAKERGHDVAAGRIDALPLDASLDAIVLFDVLEHLSLVELEEAFRSFYDALAPGGRVIARFPNGASPFGRMTQFGDLTHKVVLTADSVAQ